MAWPDRLLRAFGLQRAPKPGAQRNFAGAQFNRLTFDWVRAPLSADKELEGDLLRLRARSRDLVRNNVYARRFLKMAQNHVVGPKGVLLRPANTFANGRPYDTVNDAVREAWERWSRPQHASISGRLSLAQLERLAIAEWVTAGESLTQIVRDPTHPFGVTLHPIDADRLDQSLMRQAGDGVNEIRYGVEIDRVGRPVAYHILRAHPSEYGRLRGVRKEYDVLPAADVIHLALWDERVDLTRGIPQLAVALRDLKHLDGAQEASVIALRAAASTMGFVTTKSPDGDVETPDTDQEFEADPGVVKYLGMNQEFQAWDSGQPTDNYPDFTKAVLRGLAAGLGASYAMLANDLSEANYSSMRVGRAEEQETWMALQQWFIDHWCQRVFDAWLPAAMLAGALQVPQFDVAKASRVTWHPRRWVSPDPLKDVSAYEKEIALGITSRTRIAGTRGDDLWDVWDELKEEHEYAEEQDLDVEPPRANAAGDNANGDDTADDAADAAAPDDVAAGRGGARHARRGRRPDSDLALLRAAR